MIVISKSGRDPWVFFALVFALSIPFWIIGAVTGKQLLAGLPIAALMFVCPVMAAAILVYRRHGTSGVIALFKRSFDFGQSKSIAWYALIVLLPPGVMALSFIVMRLIGVPVPIPQLSGLTALALFGSLLIAALGEELGWMGYAIDPLQERWGVMAASAGLGAVWAAWHLIPLIQAHRSAVWIAWWCLYTVAARILMVWLYNKTGKSVFATALFHTMLNLAWLLFPVYGSYFEPRITGAILAAVAIIATVGWPSQTVVLSTKCSAA